MSEYIAEVVQNQYGEATILKEKIIRCKDCKHRPKKICEDEPEEGFNLVFPDFRCPCHCDDGYYSWMPDDDWFCGNGER